MACRGNWTGQTRSCPHTYPLRAHDQSRGPSLPACLSRRSAVLRPPSDSRCPPRDFTIGVYPGLCSSELCARADPRTPRGPAELTPDQGSTSMGLHRERLGFSVATVTRLQDSRRVTLRPAHLLPPKRLSTPRLARHLSATNQGLLPGAPVPTGTGLSPASPVQLARRNTSAAYEHPLSAHISARPSRKPAGQTAATTLNHGS